MEPSSETSSETNGNDPSAFSPLTRFAAAIGHADFREAANRLARMGAVLTVAATTSFMAQPKASVSSASDAAEAAARQAASPVTPMAVLASDEALSIGRGEKNQDRVRLIQQQLNNHGCMLAPDGDYGPATERAVQHCQKLANLEQTGTFDGALAGWLRDNPGHQPAIGGDAANFIARQECGTLAYYDRHLKSPSWPGEQSGVTIGAGYDLGHHSHAQFKADWGDKLDKADFDRLDRTIGLTGDAARRATRGLGDIEVPYEKAWDVFCNKTLPRWQEKTEAAYPGMDRLAPECQGALVSMIFNRGDHHGPGNRYREKRAIQEAMTDAAALPDGHPDRLAALATVATSLKSMKRLWTNTGLRGRRDAEANLWQAGLEKTKMAEIPALSRAADAAGPRPATPIPAAPAPGAPESPEAPAPARMPRQSLGHRRRLDALTLR